MRRFALAAWLLSVVAGTAAAQSGSYGSGSANDSHVILRGVGGSEPVMPASASSYLTGNTSTASQEVTSGTMNGGGSTMNGGGELASCEGCGQEWTDCTCPPGCGFSFFFDWTYLQPRGADSVFAARALNCFNPPLGVEQIDFGAESGYRIGFAKTLHDDCTELAFSFWNFDAQESDRAARTTGTDVILPLLLHPTQITCPGGTSTLAVADASINFDRAAIDLKRYYTYECTTFDALIGFGYGKLEQQLDVRYDENSVRVDSDLNGYGIRLGGGASRACGWVSGFAHADFTLLAANVQARYQSFDIFDGKEVDFEQDLDRLIPILDLEFGVAFNVCCHATVKVGYLYSIWWNVVTDQSFVKDVQHNDIAGGAGDTLTFDGLFIRAEFNF